MSANTPTQTIVTDAHFAQAEQIAIQSVRDLYHEDDARSYDNARQKAAGLSEDMYLGLDYAACAADEDADMREDWFRAVAHFRERARAAEVDFLVGHFGTRSTEIGRRSTT